jgi:tetratricopeptide (TPR) repeat protein
MAPILNKHPVIILVLVVLTFLVYSNTLENPFVFDSVLRIERNPDLQMAELSPVEVIRAGFKSQCLRRPVAYVTFAVNYYLHKDNVEGYHLVNITIHILAGIFFYLFINTTLQVSSPDSSNLRFSHSPNSSFIPFFGTLLWLVHPIQTQSVTYVVQRMNSMAAMFYVLSFLLYVKGRLAECLRWPWFAGCAVAGMMAVGSKEIAITLPFFILLYEWYFFQDLKIGWFKRHMPYVLGTLVVLVGIAFFYLGTAPFQVILSGYERHDFTLPERVLTEFRVVIYYISLLLYPHPSRLSLEHDFPISRSLIEPVTTVLSIGGIVGLVVLAVFLARRDRLISFCILWFLGNLVLESSIIGLALVFEHRTYLPSMCFALSVVVLVSRYGKQKWGSAIGLCVCVLFFCLWTYERNQVWGSPVSLWRDCVQKAGNLFRPHNNLGNALAQEGALGEAIVHYSKALQIDPNNAVAHYNLAITLGEQGKLKQATAQYLKAVEIKPDYAIAHYNLGLTLVVQGKVEEAISHYLEAIRIWPDYAQAHCNLGIALSMHGKLDEGVMHLSKALQLKPDMAEAHNNLGYIFQWRGRLDEAVSYYSEALHIKPDFALAHNNLGSVLVELGKHEEAVAHFSKAVGISPDYVEAHENLCKACWVLGDKGCAIREYEIVKNLDVDLAETLEKWMDEG